MPGQRISDLPAGTPPYSTSSLLEVSVPAGAGAFDTRKAILSDLLSIQKPGTTVIPANNGELTISATSNTSLTFRYKGSDGVVRSASLTLA